MQTVLKEYSEAFRKPAIPQIQSGDTVRVQQLIKEGGKQRIQAFTGTVIRTRQMSQTGANITVRWIASGVGVEKTVPLHSPLIKKVEVTKRGKVRRNFLSYLRERSGKSARLTDQGFDRETVNIKYEEPKPEQKAQDSADEQVDADITEIKEDSSVETEGSTEEVVKDENKEAGAAEPAADTDAETDEQQSPAEEVQEKLDKADDEDTRAQKPDDAI